MAEELVFKKAQKGASESFNQLIEPIQENLYKISFIYMQNEEEAIDIFLSSVSEAIKSLNKCKSHEKFEFWLVNLVLEKCKCELIKKNNKDIEVNEIEVNLICNNIKILTDTDKELILKKYRDDIKEISSLEDIQGGKIKSVINKTLKKFKVISRGA
ncbi:MAG: hypothetical protein ACRC6T_00050 [Sarcina sp.]